MTEQIGQPGPASITAEMQERVIDAIRSIRNPVDRVHAVNQTIHNLNRLNGELAALTREAVRKMHETQSYAQIGDALGITRARAQQLAAGGSSVAREPGSAVETE